MRPRTGAAVRHFELRCPDDEPEWMRYFDDAGLGHCLRDLGRSTDALAQLGAQFIHAAAPVGSDVFVTMVRADAYAAIGELAQACTTALQALDIGGAGSRSGRLVFGRWCSCRDAG